MNLPGASLTALIGTSVTVFCAVVMAAPLEPEDATPPTNAERPGSTGPARGVVRTGQTDALGTSRTVDLLVEMQGRPTAADFNERQQAQPDLSRPRPAAPAPERGSMGTRVDAAAQNDTPAGLFGTESAPTVKPQANNRPEPEWRASPRPPAAAAFGGTSAGDAARADVPPLWLLPREAIQWIRENRSLVVGLAAVVLVVLGLSSWAAGRKRR